MVVLSAVLALVAALVATVVYAVVDAGRKIEGGPSTVSRGGAAPGVTADDAPTTTKVEILSPEELQAKVEAAVRPLHTLDEAGQPVDATAFVIGSFGGQTLLLTSFSVVRAAAREPAPPIVLGESQKAELWTWQEDKDFALLVVGGSNESLPMAQVLPKKGERIYAGAAGQKLSLGVVLGISAGAIEHNIFTDPLRQGAPIVNQKGEVVAMASLTFDPAGKATDNLFIAVPVRAACERVVRCGSSNTTPGATPSTAATTTTSA